MADNNNANQARAQAPGQAGPMAVVSAQSFGAKYAGKREVYRFLTHDVGAYLSSYETMTIWHMKDLVNGMRKMLKAKEVKHVTVPQFEGLAIKDLLEFARPYDQVIAALPLVKTEIDKLPRQYIANIISTLVGKPFDEWIDKRVNARHEKRAEEGNLNIQMDPEIARIFQASTAVSTMKGTSHHLMKIGSKRRRGKLEIEEQRRLEELHKQEIEEKMARFAEMEHSIKQLQQQNQLAHNTMNGLQGLVTGGYVTVDNEGNVQPVVEESQRIQIQMDSQQTNSSLDAMGKVIDRVNNGGEGLQFNALNTYPPSSDRLRPTPQFELNQPIQQQPTGTSEANHSPAESIQQQMTRIASQPGQQKIPEKPPSKLNGQPDQMQSSLIEDPDKKDHIFRGFNGPGQRPERNTMMESTILSVTNDDGELVDVNLNLSELSKAKDDKAGAGTGSRTGQQQASTGKSPAAGQSKKHHMHK